MRSGNSLLLVVLFLFFFEVVLFFLFFFDFLFLALFVFLVVEVVGDGIQMNRMGLRDFQFGFTLRAAQDFALLDFVFVDINFGATIRAANHGTILRTRIHGRKGS
jgi:hypothetical protein